MLTFLRFARAHTIIGTSLSLLALYLIAQRDFGTSDWPAFGLSLFACLCANVYITGLNQLTDIAIDRINKPYLPLASGAWTVRKARWVVGICGLLAVVASSWGGPWLALTVLSSLALGTAYSAEPLRLKRFHFWAAFCIIVVRGLIVNLLLYLHYASVLATASWSAIPPNVWLLTGVILVFGLIIAWFKDLPDTEGDAEYGIRTLSLLRSRRWVYRTGASLLAATLLLASGYALYTTAYALSLGLGVLLLAFWVNTTRLDLDDQRSIALFYQSTWAVFFGVYAVFGLAG